VLNGPLMAHDCVVTPGALTLTASGRAGALLPCGDHRVCISLGVWAGSSWPRYARNRRLGDPPLLRHGPGFHPGRPKGPGPYTRARYKAVDRWARRQSAGRFWRLLGHIVVRVGPLTTIGPGERKVGCLGSSGPQAVRVSALSTIAAEATCGDPLTNGSKNSLLSLYDLG
jgi:hypothetical protein